MCRLESRPLKSCHHRYSFVRSVCKRREGWRRGVSWITEENSCSHPPTSDKAARGEQKCSSPSRQESLSESAHLLCCPKRENETPHSRGLVGSAGAAGEVLLEDLGVTDRVKVGVALGLLGGEALLVVVAQQLVEEVDGFVGDEPLVLRCDEAMPGLLLESTEDVVVLGVELYFVLVEVLEQLIGAEDLGDLNELIRVALAVEEGLLAEDHGGKHGSQTPHVEAVVVFLEVNQQLGSLEIPRRDSDVVLCGRVVEFSQTPVDKTELQKGPR